MSDIKTTHKPTEEVEEKHVKEPPPPPPPVEVDKRFTFPVLKPELQKRSTEIAQKASELAKLIGVTPTGAREKLSALSLLEEAVILANVDIIRNG